jgi:hypothetical protein
MVQPDINLNSYSYTFKYDDGQLDVQQGEKGDHIDNIKDTLDSLEKIVANLQGANQEIKDKAVAYAKSVYKHIGKSIVVDANKMHGNLQERAAKIITDLGGVVLKMLQKAQARPLHGEYDLDTKVRLNLAEKYEINKLKKERADEKAQPAQPDQAAQIRQQQREHLKSLLAKRKKDEK